MAGEWRATRLGDHVSLKGGLSYKGEHVGKGDALLVGMGCVSHTERFLPNGAKRYGGEFSESHRLRPGDLVIATRQQSDDLPILGYPAMIPSALNGRDVIVATNLYKITNASEIDNQFLYWLLRGREYRERILKCSKGTTVRMLTKDAIEDFEFLCPPACERERISSILDSLDDKIELNRRMNATLEAMARTLFKSWFVDFDPVRAKAEGCDPGLPQPLADLFPDSFEDSELGEIPSGWEVGPLGRFFEVGLGGAWGEDAESDRATSSVRCLRGIDCHDLAEGRVPDVPVRWVSSKQASDRQLSDGTILIEGSGSFCGRSLIWKRAYGQLLGEPIGYSNFCKRLDPICSATQAVACWMQMRQAYRDGVLQSFRTGTAFPNFDVHGTLGNLIVVVPPVPLADAYAQGFKFSQRVDLMAQSRTLAALRDVLLPKLISGEVRVQDADDLVKETTV